MALIITEIKTSVGVPIRVPAETEFTPDGANGEHSTEDILQIGAGAEAPGPAAA